MARIFTAFRVGAALALLAGGGLVTAAGPAVFGKSRPGMWQLDGIDGSKVPVRKCVADLAELARLQHPGKKCSQRLLRETDSSATFSYQCSRSDFGQTRLDWVTSQSFRIQTQGISGGLPFSYLVQARRLGECEGKAEQRGR